MLKKIGYLFGIILFILIVVGWIATTFFPERLIPMMLDRQLKSQQTIVDKGLAMLSDPDKIYVYTVGTSSPFPGERAQTGTAIIVNGHFFMFDVGDGVVQKAENFGLPMDHLDGIFITHWHSDHMIDLPSLISRSWLLGRANELHLYGPDGADTLNQAINQFLLIENRHRVDHHGEHIMDISKAGAIAHEFKNVPGGSEVVYEQDDIKITAFDVNHEPIEPAVGYVIEYKGKKIVISGDTKKDDMVIKMAKNADLLLHEILLTTLLKPMSEKLSASGNERNARIVHDIQDYHTPPQEVAAIASAANVKKLVLHHFVPPPDFRVIRNLYKKELQGYDGPIHFSNDGDLFIVE